MKWCDSVIMVMSDLYNLINSNAKRIDQQRQLVSDQTKAQREIQTLIGSWIHKEHPQREACSSSAEPSHRPQSHKQGYCRLNQGEIQIERKITVQVHRSSGTRAPKRPGSSGWVPKLLGRWHWWSCLWAIHRRQPVLPGDSMGSVCLLIGCSVSS